MSDETPDGRTARAEAKRRQRRAQILDAALEVFAERGYHATSVSDLVAAAGVARGTFYLYFESKEQVFLELLDALIAEFSASVRGVDTGPDAAPFQEQLVRSVERILAAAKASEALARIVFHEAVGLDAAVDARLGQLEDALHLYLRASLDNGIALGWLRPHDTRVASILVYGAIRHAIQRVVVNGQDEGLTPRELAAGLVEHVLRGLVA